MCGPWREAEHGTPFPGHHQLDKLSPGGEGRERGKERKGKWGNG